MESMRGVYIGRIWEDFRSLHIMRQAFFLATAQQYINDGKRLR